MTDDDARPELDEPEPPRPGDDPVDEFDGPLLPEPPHPINWNLLTADAAEAEWLELNQWVNWLRHTYGLPVSVIPPFWHRHPELVWELSALHLHWLCAYDPEQNGSAPLGWHRDFADTRQRLRDWVAASGTRLDRDRPARQTVWPGEEPGESVEDTVITNRDEDFVQFVLDDTAARRQAEDDFYARSEHRGAVMSEDHATLVSPLLDSREVAAYLKVSESTLSRWRSTGGGPLFLRLGGVARYRIDAVDAWLALLERDHDREA